MPETDDLYSRQFSKGGVPSPSQGGASTSDALLSKWDSIYGSEQKLLGQRNEEMSRATDAAIGASRESIRQGQEALATMKGKLQDAPRQDPKKMAQEMQQGAMQWLGVSAALGAIAGAFTRYHATNAMTAFAGAVKGFAQGNVQAFDENLQMWKQQSQAVRDNNEKAIEEYKLTMQSSKMNLDQKMNEIQMIASKWQDQMMASAAAQKNFTMVAQILQQKDALAYKYAQDTEKMNLQTQKVEVDMAKNGLKRDADGKIHIDIDSDSPLSQIVDAIGTYKQPPRNAGSGRGGWLNSEIMSAVQKKYPDYDVKRYNAANRAETAFGTGRQGDQVRALNVAISHLGTAEQLATALGNGDVRAINAAGQRFAQETGQPAPTNFDAARQIIGQEVVKSVVTGGGGVTERQQAAQLLSRANSPQQLAGAIRTIKQLMAGQMQGLQRQYQSSGGSNFGAKVAPETQRELGGDQGAPSVDGWSIQEVQ